VKRFILILLLTLFTCAVTALAQDDDPALIGGDLGVYSRYVWRGMIFDEKPVLQPDIWMSVHGVSMCFWGNMSLTDNDDEFEGQFNEWDVYITFPLKTFGPVSLSGELDYLSFPSPSWTAGAGTAELAGHANLDVIGSPTMSLFWDVWQFHGLYGRLNLSQALDFTAGVMDISGDLGWGNDKHNVQSGVQDAGGLLDIQLNVEFTFNVKERIDITPGMHFSTILQQNIADAYDADDIAPTSLFFSLNAALAVAQ